VISPARQLAGQPNLKKPTALRDIAPRIVLIAEIVEAPGVRFAVSAGFDPRSRHRARPISCLPLRQEQRNQ